jgi:predicted nucleotidyltransferase
LLDSERIEYLVVGGYAVSHYGYPRPTGDLDLWVAVSAENLSRLIAAIGAFGFAAAGTSPGLFETPGTVVRMGVPPVRIEIMNRISGVDFETCYSRRQRVVWDGVPVSLIAREDLVTNKRAAGREKDRNDLKHLSMRPKGG